MKNVLYIVGGLVVIGGVVYWAMQSPSDPAVTATTPAADLAEPVAANPITEVLDAAETAAGELQPATMKDDMKDDMKDGMHSDMKDTMQDDMKKDDMSAAGTYAPYSADAVASQAAARTVLFFKASWCPSCRALDSDITANQGDIPADVAIYAVDYDSATTLRQRYGVTTQHTLVEIAKDGTLVKKWSGGPTLARVVAEL